MIRRPPISPRTDTLLPDTTLFRSRGVHDLAELGRELEERHELPPGSFPAGDHRGVAVTPGLRELVEVGLSGLHGRGGVDRRSEEHTSELQSLMRNSYAVFCLTKTNNATT